MLDIDGRLSDGDKAKIEKMVQGSEHRPMLDMQAVGGVVVCG